MEAKKIKIVIGFGLGMLMSVCAGTIYAWGSIKMDIQEIFDWSLTELSYVYSVGAWGTFIGFPPGRVLDTNGACVASVYNLFFLSTGFGMMAMQCLTQFSTSPWIMGLWFGMAGHGSLGMYIVALSTNISNISSKHRGMVVGSMALCLALSGALFTAIYRNVFLGHVHEYLVMLTITTSTLSLAGVLFVRKVPIDTDEWRGTESSFVNSPIRRKSVTAPSNIQRHSVSLNTATTSWGGHLMGPVSKNVSLGDLTGLPLLTHREFLLLSLIFALCQGSGLTVIGQLADIARSNGYDAAQKLSLISGVSYANCLGRISMGALSDRTQFVFRRTYWIVICIVLMMFSHTFMFLMQDQGSALWVGVLMCGFAFGGLWSVLPTFLSERFGKLNFGFNFGVFTISLAIGNTVLNQSSSAMYDAQADNAKQCLGEACFRYTFAMLAGACFVSMLVAFWLIRCEKETNEKLTRERLL